MTKRTLTIIILITLSISIKAQVTQIGIVRELNSNGKTMSGVGITIPTASDVQPAYSDNNGVFLLIFSEKKVGDILHNIRISKPNYEVVNHQLLKDGWTLTEKDTLEIILAKSQLIAESRAKYYNIIDQYQIQQYNATISKLKKELEAEKITATEFSERADAAEIALQDAYDQIDFYADKLARINRDKMDSISRTAFQFLEKGDVEAAIEVYASQNLLEQLEKKVALRDESIESIRYIIPKLQEEAQYRQMAAGKENIDKVDSILAHIAVSDTNDFKNTSDYVEFLIQQEELDRALEWNQLIINRKAPYDHFSTALQRKGHVMYRKNNFDEAEKYLLECLDMDKNNNLDDSIKHLDNISYTMNTLGNLYLDSENFEKSEYYLTEALNNRKILFQKDSTYIDNYATSLNNIGELYRTIGEPEKAIPYYQESIILRQKLADKKPSEFSYPLANSYNNLGQTYIDLNDYENAQKYYFLSEEVLKKLYGTNPEYYSKIYIILLNNIGHLYQKTDNNEKADEYYNKAISLCRERSQNNPETYQYLAGAILNNLGSFSFKTKNYEKALTYHDEALQIRKGLIQYSKSYETEVAQSLHNIARVYDALDREEDAKQSFLESNRIYKEAAKIKASYQNVYIISCNAIAYLYEKEKDNKNAKKYLKEALKTYKLIAKRNTTDYSKEILELKKEIKKL